MTPILDLFEPLAIAIVLCGIVIMVWGIIFCFIQFFRTELSKKETPYPIDVREKIRIQLGTYLLLGLEFFIAVDIIHSAHNPQLESLYDFGIKIPDRYPDQISTSILQAVLKVDNQ